MASEVYNIDDLQKAEYRYVFFKKTGILTRTKVSGVRRGVLYKNDEKSYIDVISNTLVPKDDIVGDLEPFIARDTLLSRQSVIAIFDYIEDIRDYDQSDTLVSSSNVLEEAADKFLSLKKGNIG